MSSQEVKSPLLIVAGVHNETSLGWSAAEAWLDRDPNNHVLATVRSEDAQEFVEAEAERLGDQVSKVVIPDWMEPSASTDLRTTLEELVGEDRRVAGVVHAIASAPLKSLYTPAHELDSSGYRDAIGATAISLLNTVRGARQHLVDKGGVVTFGFSEYHRVNKDYGAALSTAKVALSHLVAELAYSLGQDEPSARTAEVVTGFVPTHAARGVALGIAKARRDAGYRVRPQDLLDFFTSSSAMKAANHEEQRRNSGLIAVDFIANPMWNQTSGQRFEVNAGWSLMGQSITPPSVSRDTDD